MVHASQVLGALSVLAENLPLLCYRSTGAPPSPHLSKLLVFSVATLVAEDIQIGYSDGDGEGSDGEGEAAERKERKGGQKSRYALCALFKCWVEKSQSHGSRMSRHALTHHTGTKTKRYARGDSGA